MLAEHYAAAISRIVAKIIRGRYDGGCITVTAEDMRQQSGINYINSYLTMSMLTASYKSAAGITYTVCAPRGIRIGDDIHYKVYWMDQRDAVIVLRRPYEI